MMNKTILCLCILISYAVLGLATIGLAACWLLHAFFHDSLGSHSTFLQAALLILVLAAITTALMVRMGFDIRHDRPLRWLYRQIYPFALRNRRKPTENSQP